MLYNQNVGNNNTIFPQVQGNVYFVNSSVEANNIPFTQNGVSVGVCFNEGLLYMKGIQNGNQVSAVYELIPHDPQALNEDRINKVEEKLNTILAYLSQTNKKEVDVSDLI